MSDSTNILEQVTSFIDGELSADDANELTQRMIADTECAQLVHAQRATKAVLKARLTKHDAPAEFKQRLQVMLFSDARDETSAPYGDARELRRFPRLFGWSPVAATTLAAVVFLAVLSVVLLTFSGDRIGPYMADVYAHHMDPDAFPIEHTGDHQTVAGNMSTAAGFDVTVPNLGPRGELEGARQCTLCGHPIAFIKYTGELGRISFFVIPKHRPAIWRLDRIEHDAMVFYIAPHEDLRMAFWRENGTTYCLAAAVASDDLIGLACTACEQVKQARINETDHPGMHPVLTALSTVRASIK